MRVFDCFPFFDELDMLEIRLQELSSLVDKFIIVEAAETYGGDRKQFNLRDNWERFREFHGRIAYLRLSKLLPACSSRITGREREAYQRNALMSALLLEKPQADDVIIFSDCDEIPRMTAVRNNLETAKSSIHRLKQRTFYYHTGWLVDYGSDFASRARMGSFAQLQAEGSFYAFRMFRRDDPGCPVIENGGWHFSYFGGTSKIKSKTAALAPYLAEYRLFGDEQMHGDIEAGRDVHHRRGQVPAQFRQMADDDLPEYILENAGRFAHFFAPSLQPC